MNTPPFLQVQPQNAAAAEGRKLEYGIRFHIIARPTSAEAWAADMVMKVKEPIASEYGYLRPGLLLFTYLHLAPDPDQTRDLLASGATAIEACVK